MSNKTIIEIRAEIIKETMEKLRQQIGQQIVVTVSDGDAERIKKYIAESY